MAKSDYLENALVNHVLRNTALTSPTVVYVALSTTDPLDTGAGITEPVALGYARVAVEFDAPTNGVTQNTNVETFGPASGSWATLTHMAVFDALTGGNMLYHGILTASKTVDDGDSIEFAAGNLSITES